MSTVENRSSPTLVISVRKAESETPPEPAGSAAAPTGKAGVNARLIAAVAAHAKSIRRFNLTIPFVSENPTAGPAACEPRIVFHDGRVIVQMDDFSGS